jgi:outer membrane protein assembly factor BamB
MTEKIRNPKSEARNKLEIRKPKLLICRFPVSNFLRISSFGFQICTLLLTVSVFAADWPMWGGTPQRNMVSAEKGLPDLIAPGKFKSDSEEVDMATTKNVKWVAKLGSQAYGNVTVAGGKVFVGTNNESPRDPKYKGDYGMVMCFDEKTGKFLWQQAVPKLGSGKVNDWEYLGICSSPLLDGDRVYVMSSRCEVLCLDAIGMANGNDGPFKDEAQYVAGPGKPPIEQGATDGDIIWRFDMREELGVFPHNITSSSILMVGERLYCTTSNGQDWSHLNIPAPFAPSLICLDKKTGKLLGEEASGISKRLFHSNWSSPAFGNGVVFFGAGDGHVYAFDPVPVRDEKEDRDVLKEIWRFDCNPPEYKERRYPAAAGPSEVIATPVFYNNRVYVTIGQDPEHGDGVGALSCIDAASGKKIWQYTGIRRSISTVSIADDLLFVADYAGKVHCLDALSGKLHWVHDTQAHIWGSTLVADGKVYIGAEDGLLWILAAGKQKKVINKIDFGAPIYSTPVVANGVLYIGTQTHLYAVNATR